MIKILHFTADWCMPCQRLKPIINDFVDNNPTVIYQTIDVDNEFDLALEYEIKSVPTLVIFKDNEIIKRHTGIISYPDLDKLING